MVETRVREVEGQTPIRGSSQGWEVPGPGQLQAAEAQPFYHLGMCSVQLGGPVGLKKSRGTKMVHMMLCLGIGQSIMKGILLLLPPSAASLSPAAFRLPATARD